MNEGDYMYKNYPPAEYMLAAYDLEFWCNVFVIFNDARMHINKALSFYVYQNPLC